MIRWIRGYSRIFSITWISQIILFPFVSISFAYTSRNRLSMEFPRKDKLSEKNLNPRITKSKRQAFRVNGSESESEK